VNVLMIGGTGFISGCVSHQLLAAGHKLAIFHRGETNSAVTQHASEILGDRNQLRSYRETFGELSPDVVIDMIALTEDDGRQLIGTFRNLAPRLVVISSADVYRRYELLRGIGEAEPDPRKLTEDAPLRTKLFPYRSETMDASHHFYNYDKILVESAVSGDPDLPSTVLRLPAVYGPGDKQRRLFHYLKRMDDGRPAILVESGLFNWHWTRGYVENVAAAICAVAGDQNTAGRIYNVGEIRGLTEFEWISSIAAEVGWQGQIVAVNPTDLPEQKRSNLSWQHDLETDTSLIRNILGFSEPITIGEGLRRTIQWQRLNPPPEIKPEDFDYAAEDRVLADLT
jgi:nucleoside-diphosphate-sugar epimerase